MSGAICPKCWKSTNDATPPKCDRADCPTDQTFGRLKTAVPIEELLVHLQPKIDACEHEFTGWRMFSDGNGGEQVCSKCGMGAAHYTLMKGD